MSFIRRNYGRLVRGVQREGTLRFALSATREILFPHGSARDQVWSRWGRPVVRRLRGYQPPPPPPVVALTRWTSPANRVLAPESPIKTILVIKVDHVGDLLLAAPAIALLRRSFPDARIDLLCASWNAGLARRLGVFATVHVHDFFTRKGDSRKSERAGTAGIEKLGLRPYDLAIDLRVDEDTRGVLGHVQARCKAGYRSQLMPPDMTIVLPQPGSEHPDDAGIQPHQRALMLALVAAVIACFDPQHDTREAIARITAEAAPEIAALRRDWPGPVVTVNTASGREIKNWPIARFAALCHWMTTELPATVVLLGGPDQVADAASVVAAAGERVVNLVGKLPMDRSLALVAASDLFVGNDSALTHAAAAMGVPTVAIFSGIDPIAMWGPLGPHVTALRVPIACSPCHLSYVTDCEFARACVTRIEVEDVRAAVSGLLASGR